MSSRHASLHPRKLLDINLLIMLPVRRRQRERTVRWWCAAARHSATYKVWGLGMESRVQSVEGPSLEFTRFRVQVWNQGFRASRVQVWSLQGLGFRYGIKGSELRGSKSGVYKVSSPGMESKVKSVEGPSLEFTRFRVQVWNQSVRASRVTVCSAR